MKSLLFLLISFFLSNCLISQEPNASSGRIERVSLFPSSFVAARNIDIWLPEGYNRKKKYAVLYMHDGQMLYDSTITWNKTAWDVDDVASELINVKKVKGFIVVGIWNGGPKRKAEYFPQKPFESLTQTVQDTLYGAIRSNGESEFKKNKVQSDKYLLLIVKELKPYIDKKYSTLKDRANTFVAGSSMGGLISMYAICEYPDVFGGATCLSTHWPGISFIKNNPVPQAFFTYLDTHLPDPKSHKLYFDHGTATLDAMYPALQKKVDEIIKAKGYDSANWITKEFPGEDHSETAWRKRLHTPLEFLLKVN